MKEITLIIDGKQVKGREGDTVLDVCRANDIDVPTLCHMDGLSDVGACRLCVVDIEGERRINPSCTYPARDGLVVQTSNEKLDRYRRLMLELMFAERNHFCMYCEQSGDCELQKLAYRYQMDNVRYPYSFPSLSLDTLSEYVAIDHNRCVLCGRCVRTCREIVASRTLDFAKRGWKTMISADLDQPLGESSCIACGACVQACPTGAIFSRLGQYRGNTSECEQVSTVCPVCSAGCEINVMVKDNNVIRIESPSLVSPRGPLCEQGRFGLLLQTRGRVTSPMIRDKQGNLQECTMDEAVAAAASRLLAGSAGFAGMISTRYPDETLVQFREFVKQAMGSDELDTLDGNDYRLIAEGIRKFRNDRKGLDLECPIEEILEADCILVVGADPLATHPVVGCLVRRAVDQRKAKLITIDAVRDAFPLWSDLWLRPSLGSEGVLLYGLAKTLIDRQLVRGKEVPRQLANFLNEYDAAEVSRATGVDGRDLEAAAQFYGRAERAVIIYGAGMLERNDSNLITYLFNLADLTGNGSGDHMRVVSLKPGANSRGAWQLGVAAKDIRRNKPKMVYLLLADEPEDEELLSWLGAVDTLVVQASHESAITSMADVVLPSPTWDRREQGRYVSLDGRVSVSRPVLQAGDGLLQDRDTMIRLSRKLGRELGPGQEVDRG
jgi:formate dehydrogenase major subunit